MRHTSLFVVMAAMFAASPSTAADIDALGDVRITIRSYDNTTLPSADRLSAIATATKILKAAGLNVEWRACEAAFVRAPEDLCTTPLGRNELALRFVMLPSSPDTNGNVALGYSLVDTHTRGGSLATVYVDRVAGLARTCRIDARSLLGRTIAHEIGHLLLGTMNHAPSGLMRAVWSAEAIRRSRAGDWLFTPREGRAMRDAVRTRAAQQLAAHIVWGD